MKSPLWNIISILVITLVLLSGYSFSDYSISFADIEVRKIKFPEKDTVQTYIANENQTVLPDLASQQESLSETIPTQVAKPALDTSAQRILLIGDSMLEGILLRLKQYVAFNNHKIKTVIWYSSTTKWYGKSDTLAYYIRKWKPTYVILVLGANELFIRNIIERNQHYVEHIIDQMDTLKYVWIGPPNWRDDTGINDLIIKNVDKGQYYPSKNLVLKRARDGAHPVHSAAAIWTDSITNWIVNSSKYPIRLNKPDTIVRCSANVTILQPKRK